MPVHEIDPQFAKGLNTNCDTFAFHSSDTVSNVTKFPRLVFANLQFQVITDKNFRHLQSVTAHFTAILVCSGILLGSVSHVGLETSCFTLC